MLFTAYGLVVQMYSALILQKLFSEQLYGPALIPVIGAATSAVIVGLSFAWLAFLFMLVVCTD